MKNTLSAKQQSLLNQINEGLDQITVDGRTFIKAQTIESLQKKGLIEAKQMGRDGAFRTYSLKAVAETPAAPAEVKIGDIVTVENADHVASVFAPNEFPSKGEKSFRASKAHPGEYFVRDGKDFAEWIKADDLKFFVIASIKGRPVDLMSAEYKAALDRGFAAVRANTEAMKPTFTIHQEEAPKPNMTADDLREIRWILDSSDQVISSGACSTAAAGVKDTEIAALLFKLGRMFFEVESIRKRLKHLRDTAIVAED